MQQQRKEKKRKEENKTQARDLTWLSKALNKIKYTRLNTQGWQN